MKLDYNLPKDSCLVGRLLSEAPNINPLQCDKAPPFMEHIQPILFSAIHYTL
jgi:hypothetical protein